MLKCLLSVYLGMDSWIWISYEMIPGFGVWLDGESGRGELGLAWRLSQAVAVSQENSRVPEVLCEC